MQRFQTPLYHTENISPGWKSLLSCLVFHWGGMGSKHRFGYAQTDGGLFLKAAVISSRVVNNHVMGPGFLRARYSVPGVTGISVPVSPVLQQNVSPLNALGPLEKMVECHFLLCVRLSLWSRLCSHHWDQRLSLAFWEYQCWRIGWYTPQLLFLRKARGHAHTHTHTHTHTHALDMRSHELHTCKYTSEYQNRAQASVLPSHMRRHTYSNTL